MVDGVADAPGIGHLIYLAGQPYVVETVTRHVSPGQGAGGQTRLAINVTLRYPHRANEGVHIASIGGNP
jgi:hypothetical protein